MRSRLISLLFSLVVLPAVATAQVLTTAQTIGKGSQALMVTENRIYVGGDELNIAYLQYVRGFHPRFDLYASFGGTRIFREDQIWVGLGGNLNVFHSKHADVSLFNVFSTSAHRRHDSSTVLLNSAIVVSHNVNKTLSLYSGMNGLFPIGAKERGLFTPPTKKLNVPIGAGIFRGKWSLFAEVDIGSLKALGIGIGRTF